MIAAKFGDDAFHRNGATTQRPPMYKNKLYIAMRRSHTSFRPNCCARGPCPKTSLPSEAILGGLSGPIRDSLGLWKHVLEDYVGRHWALVGPSWGPLGPSWGPLDPLCGLVGGQLALAEAISEAEGFRYTKSGILSISLAYAPAKGSPKHPLGRPTQIS